MCVRNAAAMNIQQTARYFCVCMNVYLIQQQNIIKQTSRLIAADGYLRLLLLIYKKK